MKLIHPIHSTKLIHSGQTSQDAAHVKTIVCFFTSRHTSDPKYTTRLKLMRGSARRVTQ